MRVVRVVAFVTTLLMANACREDTVEPQRLGQRLEKIAAEPMSNPPTQVFRYRYRGEVVYYRPPRCCDVQGELYDAQGELVCFPDGGFSGRGDGRCADFHAVRSDCEVVWSDPRAKPGTLPGCATNAPRGAPRM